VTARRSSLLSELAQDLQLLVSGLVIALGARRLGPLGRAERFTVKRDRPYRGKRTPNVRFPPLRTIELAEHFECGGVSDGVEPGPGKGGIGFAYELDLGCQASA
jgi:hypothetical protein